MFVIAISDETIFRYACFHSFNVKNALAAIEKHDSSHQHLHSLRMQGRLEKQFASRTIFPLPSLKTKKGRSNVMYMRPSRYTPNENRENDSEMIVQSLCYVLNDMSNTKKKCRRGVAVIANMKGFTRENYSVGAWSHLMQALQGNLVPTKVELLLIVDPPSWFRSVWNKVIKPKMMSNSFAKKVHIVSQDRLSDFFSRGYEQFLPEDMSSGWQSTIELVDDYVDKKSYANYSFEQF